MSLSLVRGRCPPVVSASAVKAATGGCGGRCDGAGSFIQTTLPGRNRLSNPSTMGQKSQKGGPLSSYSIPGFPVRRGTSVSPKPVYLTPLGDRHSILDNVTVSLCLISTRLSCPVIRRNTNQGVAAKVNLYHPLSYHERAYPQ